VTRRGRRLAVVVALAATTVVVLLAALSLGTSSAATLLVTARSLTATRVAPPCGTTPVPVTNPASATATAPSTQVVVSAPAACAGQPLRLRLYGANGAPLQTADVTGTVAAAGTTTLTVPSYAASGVAGAALTLGTWGRATTWTVTPSATPSPGTCSVVTAAGQPTGKPCEILDLTAPQWWGTAPTRQANLYFHLSAPNLASGERIVVTLDLSQAVGLPSGWRWSTSGASGGNLLPYPNQSCSLLPSLTAYAPTWAADGNQIYFPISENRAGQSNLICS